MAVLQQDRLPSTQTRPRPMLTDRGGSRTESACDVLRVVVAPSQDNSEAQAPKRCGCARQSRQPDPYLRPSVIAHEPEQRVRKLGRQQNRKKPN